MIERSIKRGSIENFVLIGHRGANGVVKDDEFGILFNSVYEAAFLGRICLN